MATVKMVALAQFIASKVGATAITVTCDVDEYDADNSTVDNAYLTAQSMTHVRNGIYRLFFDGDDSLLYVATAKTSDSSVDQQHIPAVVVRLERVNNADVATSTRSTVTTAQVNTEVDTALADVGLTTTVTGRIDAAVSSRLAAAAYSAAPSAADNADAVWDEVLAGHATAGTAGALLTASGAASDPLLNTVPGSYASGTAGYILGSINPAQVTVTSPVATDGTSITVVRGDDYLNTDGRALTFTGATWPTLTAGTVALIVDVSGTPTSYAGVITGSQACYVELTDTQTAALNPKKTYDYDLQATLSNGSVVTLVQGLLLVSADVR